MKKIPKILMLFVAIIIVLFCAFYMANELNLLTGFPKGVDPYAHLTRIKYILNYFPQLSLNPFWNSGTPYWIWSYPPFSFFPSSFLSYFLNLSPEISMNMVASFHLGIFFVGLFLSLYFLSENLWLALGLSIVAAFTPATWSWWGHGGNYVRLFGMGFWTLTLAFLIRHIKKEKKSDYLLYLIFACLTFNTHFIFVNLLALLIFFIVLFTIPGFKRKIKSGFIYLGIPFLISSYWFIPMFLTSGGQSRFVQGAFAKPVLFEHFLNLDPYFPYFTLDFIITGILFISLLMGLFRLFRKKFKNKISGIFVALGIVTFVQIGYLVLGNIPNWPIDGYLAVITPSVSLPILIVHGFLLAASAFSKGLGNFFDKYLSIVIFLGIAAFSFFYIKSFLPFPQNGLYDVSKENQHQPGAQREIAKAKLTPEYRFGTDSGFISDWFNYVYPNIPQTRDYIYQGIPYKDWQFFQEKTIWATPNAYNETLWLMDWYAINYFSVGKASAEVQFDKFLDKPDLFKKIGELPLFYVFKYNFAKPILSASNTKTILVISDNQNYDNFVRLIALSGVGSDKLIPVWGKNGLTSISQNDLNQFDSVAILIDDLARDELSKLQTYVKSGGSLFFETNTLSEKYDILPDPYPVNKIYSGTRNNNWNFSGELLNFEEINNFSKADYQGSPWKVIETSDIKAWAKPLVISNNIPVMVYGSYGKGKVFWSGMNFIFHAISNNNSAEAELFTRILNLLININELNDLEEIKWTSYTPQKRTLNIPNTKGILVKESWFKNWKASVKVQGKINSLKVYPAGPSLMYIPLEGLKEGTLYLKYAKSFEEILGIIISILSVLVVTWFLTKKEKTKIIDAQGKIKLKLLNWWGKEDDY